MVSQPWRGLIACLILPWLWVALAAIYVFSLIVAICGRIEAEWCLRREPACAPVDSP